MIDNRKNILIFISQFYIGGIPMQAFKWAMFFKKHKYNPIILTLKNESKKYEELLLENGIQYEIFKIDMKSKNIFIYFLNLVKLVNRFQPVAILPFQLNLSFTLNLIWRFSNAKKCFHLIRNDGKFNNKGFLNNILKKISLYLSSGIISNSEHALLKYNFKKKHIVIKNSTPFNVINCENKILFTEEYVLHIGNLYPEKNYKLLLESWEHISKIYPKLLLVIIGSFSNYPLNFDKKLLFQNNVIYLGSLLHTKPFIDHAKLCLLSSFSEGCPNVILEYIKFNKLIVASNILATREVLSIGNYKFLFDNNSKQDLLNKIILAINIDYDEQKKLIEENYNKIINEYSDNNYLKILSFI